MRFTAMAYNMMGVFEEVCKAKQPDHIHLADKNTLNLSKKGRLFAEVKGKGGFVKPLFFHARMTRRCSFTIGSLQDAIMTARSVMAIMDSLARYLIPRMAEIVER